ncbi:hypothetical protein L1887_21420 [Cichorium endivia]|nr:hypothetical protein L1887_21420 [Cichorium endivia]
MGDHEDPPSNSTEEADHQEQDVVPGGRLYECIFCKRGFTTAQALGGHMNIHRKDRAKGKPNDLSNSCSSKLEDRSCYAGPRSRFYQPVLASYTPSYISTAPSDQEGLVRYTKYFSSTSSTVQPINHENYHQDVHGVITRPSSLQFGWSDDQNLKRTIDRCGNEEDELDLELRLGHDP